MALRSSPRPHGARAAPARPQSQRADPGRAFEDNRLASVLFGEFDQNLAMIEQRLGVDAVARGNQVLIRGTRDARRTGAPRPRQASTGGSKSGDEIETGDVDGAIRMADAQGALFDYDPTSNRRAGSPWRRSRPRKQVVHGAHAGAGRLYPGDGRAEMVFGVGPAGTGKTYLAVAYAAALLERGTVERLILSRPAVEAGERLGFLPGDMKEKVDPYLSARSTTRSTT